MNRLEKKAWANLGGMILCVIIAGPGIWWMASNNIKGPVVLIPFLISGLIAGSITYLKSIKHWAKLDEREKNIAQRAGRLSSGVFILFLYCASFTVFLVVGAKGPVPAYLLPAMFLSGLFLMVFVYSAAILVQFARERDDE
ncbi:MAG: hypothetical protein ABSB91_07680 [Sedimentisphaerales bacterium]